jgi:hypothetical protein
MFRNWMKRPHVVHLLSLIAEYYKLAQPIQYSYETPVFDSWYKSEQALVNDNISRKDVSSDDSTCEERKFGDGTTQCSTFHFF